jgi:hypothetical protein
MGHAGEKKHKGDEHDATESGLCRVDFAGNISAQQSPPMGG